MTTSSGNRTVLYIGSIPVFGMAALAGIQISNLDQRTAAPVAILAFLIVTCLWAGIGLIKIARAK